MMTERPALVDALARVAGIKPVDLKWRCGPHLRRLVQRDSSLVLVYASHEILLAPLPLDGTEAAVESLSPDLWPWHVSDVGAPRWLCVECGGEGLNIDLTEAVQCGRCGDGTDHPDHVVAGPGHTQAPPDLPALIALSSLGRPALLRVAALADALAPGAQLVFLVATRDELAARHGGVWDGAYRRSASDRSLVEIFAGEALNAGSGPDNAPFGHMARDYGSDHATAPYWPHAAALFELFVHLLEMPAVGSGGRIVLGFEAVGNSAPLDEEDGDRSESARLIAVAGEEEPWRVQVELTDGQRIWLDVIVSPVRPGGFMSQFPPEAASATTGYGRTARQAAGNIVARNHGICCVLGPGEVRRRRP